MIQVPGLPISADAQAFAEALDGLLTKHASPAALRTAWDAPDARIPGLWQKLEEIGIFELASEGLLETLIPAVVVTGRHALPEPLIGNLAAAIVTGKIPTGVVACQTGAATLTPDAAIAESFLVQVEEGWAEHSLLDVEVTSAESIDPTARLGVVEVEDDVSGFHPLIDITSLLAAAQLQGLAEGLLSQAVDYAKIREQFGSPIGSFQAVKHQLADVYVAIGFSRPVLDEAARDLSPETVSHAKVAATEAALRAARTALQVHGGIGYTFEHDLHMWTKKIWTLSKAWGDVRFHRGRITELVLGEVE